MQLNCRDACSQPTKTRATQIQPEPKNESLLEKVRAKGWEHLLDLTVRSGIDPKPAVEAFASSEMPKREFLVFSLNPKEKKASYRPHNTRAKRANAYNFFLENKQNFVKAKSLYSVPESVVLAILQVETACGKNTGDKDVFPAIARLANAGEPENLKKNLQSNQVSQSDAVYKRAVYLETTFLPHLIATFKLAPNAEVHRLRGSFAGAIGMPQFMPDNILKYGIDGDENGKVDLYSTPDAIFSTANYLKGHGWNTLKLANAKRRAVIWEYNRSQPYIDTVLNMADELQKMIDSGACVQIVKNDKHPKKYSRKPSRPASRVHHRNKKSSRVLQKHRH